MEHLTRVRARSSTTSPSSFAPRSSISKTSTAPCRESPPCLAVKCSWWSLQSSKWTVHSPETITPKWSVCAKAPALRSAATSSSSTRRSSKASSLSLRPTSCPSALITYTKITRTCGSRWNVGWSFWSSNKLSLELLPSLIQLRTSLLPWLRRSTGTSRQSSSSKNPKQWPKKELIFSSRRSSKRNLTLRQ